MKKAVTIRMDEAIYNGIANDAKSQGTSMNKIINDRVTDKGNTINVNGNLYNNCTINYNQPGNKSTDRNNVIEGVSYSQA